MVLEKLIKIFTSPQTHSPASEPPTADANEAAHTEEHARKPMLEYLETHIVDHCNINCRGCYHYCNITNKNFINIDTFKNDMAELSQKFDIGKIRLMGGEPLLAPNVEEFILATRKYFPDTDIRLVTNGILLGKKSEYFWDVLKSTKVKIDLSKYPIGGTSFSEALDAIGSHVFNFYRNDDWRCITQETALGDMWIAGNFQLTMDSQGNNDADENFNICPHKRCINLINGKLVHCPTAGYLGTYNSYFNKNFPVDEGINLYTNSSREILDYLSKSIPMCSFCVFDERMKLQKWAVSKKEADEWFADKN